MLDNRWSRPRAEKLTQHTAKRQTIYILHTHLHIHNGALPEE